MATVYLSKDTICLSKAEAIETGLFHAGYTDNVKRKRQMEELGDPEPLTLAGPHGRTLDSYRFRDPDHKEAVIGIRRRWGGFYESWIIDPKTGAALRI